MKCQPKCQKCEQNVKCENVKFMKLSKMKRLPLISTYKCGVVFSVNERTRCL